jgi:glycosyltransferase involved in cell wall biosynthesis/Flp pilus assembly protein TadD
MARRYLFGPVSTAFAQQHLWQHWPGETCKVFDLAPGAEVSIRAEDDWNALLGALPAEWQPDFLVLYLQYRTIPPWLFQAPVPVIALAGDWNLQWHAYRQLAQSCDRVLTDREGAERFNQAGIAHARPAILFGGERDFLESPWPEVARDIDVLFVGNFHGAVQRERMPLLGRLARLRERWNVLFATNVHGEEYRRVLARSRIVFNRGIRGEWNTRVCEALAAGALLFQEADNREVLALLQDRKECVAYTPDTLVCLAEYYLGHEEERKAIAEAGRARVQEFSFGRFWQEQLDAIEEDWDTLLRRASERAEVNQPVSLAGRTWQVYPTTAACDPVLVADLRATAAAGPRDADANCDLGWVQAMARYGNWRQAAETVLPLYRQAWTSDSTHAIAGLNVAEALLELGRTAEAAEQARATLAALEGLDALPAAVLDAGHYRPEFDHFRVCWEQAAWAHAGEPANELQAKAQILRWRLHLLLGDLTGEVRHYVEAADAQPEVPVSWAALGCALGRHGRVTEAVPHLQRAVDGNPFDLDAARALFQALGMAGIHAEQEAFARARRHLALAAPQLVPAEPWHAEKPSRPAREFPQLGLEQFHRIFGAVDTARAICAFTVPRDAHVVLTLLSHAGARRILEVGTAAGHMTANLTEWSPDDAHVFSLGAVADLGIATPHAQRPEDPPRSAFGAQANHFGKGHKAYLIAADSLAFDFQRLAPLDFAFIDGAHDRRHVLSDSLGAYRALRPGGYLVWHDFGSPTPWVEVRQALEQLPFPEPIYHVAGTEVAFLRKQQPIPVAVPCPSAAREVGPGGPPAIIWEGDQAVLHSLALVNREFCRGLIERGFEVSILPETHVPAEPLGVPPCVAERFHRPLSRPAEVHVRQQWPPNWTPPPAGHWVLMQPWEFGRLPRQWVARIVEAVDEVWANSRYVRDVYVESGVPADRVHLVPLGVRVDQFRPDRPPYPLKTTTGFRFLFVGGTIARKGIDLLLAAYTRAFRRHDDVCLVIKDMGVGTFYRGQTAEARITEIQSDPDAPEVEYLTQSLTEDELAGLYTACSCLAHPYRGEGFGMPIAEAMAAGLPAIVTGLGAALDYCTPDNAFLIPAIKRHFPEPRVGDLETAGLPWLAEPDLDALAELMRYAAANPDEVRRKGERAAAHIRSHLTWDQAVAAAERRLLALRHKPLRRAAVPVGRTAKVSLCMIVRNEERFLPECLRSVADLVDETVVVDSGSTDRTREIAEGFGARVIDFQWVDSFADARNESLRHATGNWVLWMDADERLDAANRERLRALLAGLGSENAGYVMRQSSRLEAGHQAVVHVDQVRLFPNHPGLAWRYRVHEQILPGLRALGASVRPTDIVIEHAGFAEATLQGPKVDRNWRLLQRELEEHPDDTFVLYNLGAVALTQGRLAEALAYFQQFLDRAEPDDNLLPKVHALVTRCRHQEGRRDLALQACQTGRAAFPQDAELLFWEAVLLHERGDLAGAESSLTQLLALPRGLNFTSADSGMQGYRARQFLAEVCWAQGRTEQAEAHLHQVLAECPGFPPSLRLLAECQREQGRWPELDRTLAALRQHPEEADQADLIQARAYLARREFSQARAVLVPLTARVPQAIWPRVILSHVLLQEGKDAVAAEKALRDVLALDPGNAEARHNLQVLLSQRETGSQPGGEANGRVGHATRQRVSLCMIVKDEEANLPDCLASVADLVDEVIVVDTGSADATREVATRHGARVFDFPWVDSFAAARNESLRHATGDWVFWMDADDRLDDENRARLRNLFASLRDENAAYVMKCRCLPDPHTEATTEVDHLRLFRNRPDLRWEFRIHEQILPAVRAAGGDVRWSDVVILHTGYQDPALRGRKLQRDLRLLMLEQAERPDCPFALFNLGSIYQEQGRLEEAIPLFRRSLELSKPDASIVRKLYALIAQCANQLRRHPEALAACQEGRDVYPDDVEILFQEGITLRSLGDLEGAARRWEAVLHLPRGDHFASLNVGIRGYLTRQNLAVTYRDLGRSAEAESQWQLVLDEHPDYEPALAGLADLYVIQKRWADLEALAGRVESRPGGKLRAALLRGRGMLARHEFAAAQAAFAAVAAEAPDAVEPRVLLSYAYLQEGRDWIAAEAALRAVLALDPNHAEARHNLDVLLRQVGKDSDRAPVTTLADLFQAACAADSALGEFGPALSALAQECRHVTEVGARDGFATTAFLYAQPETLVCYAAAHLPTTATLRSLAGRTNFVLHDGGALPAGIEETDLMFLDLEPDYEPLAHALRAYAPRVRRYIIVPGRTTLGQNGRPAGGRGLWPAVEELLAQGTFRLKERSSDRGGLTILERS